MVGAVLVVIVMVLVIPVGTMLGGALWSALSGWLQPGNVEVGRDGLPVPAE